jgi:menaquinol-cytochrome c reductase cytochrome b/c subunit
VSSAKVSHPGDGKNPDYSLVAGADPRKDPVRLLVVQGDARPAVDVSDEPMVMTVPHLVLRELIALLAISLVLVVISLFVDAPLEELANPERTPNPAKAPWYFLGLQELLHYYPPLVAGVLIPGIVVFALVVIPYFDVNLGRRPLWSSGRRRLPAFLAAVGGVTVVLMVSGAHPMWPVIGPLWLVALLALAPLVLRGSVARALGSRSLAFWIFGWFLLSAFALTMIGVFFRGPGWALTLPWRDGIFY